MPVRTALGSSSYPHDPVSYTHLDVYKRQAQCRHEYQQQNLIHATARFPFRFFDFHIRGRFGFGFGPVSYTHLDVYKRQSFTRRELEILFSLPDTTEKLGWRDLVLLCVMYSSGARAQEICDLTVKDVTHDEKGNALLTLVGKGEKARRVKITSSATQLLDKYIASRKISTELNRHVFHSQRNDHLSVAAVEEIYEKYTKRAKAEHPELFCHGPYTPHVMRHTTATHQMCIRDREKRMAYVTVPKDLTHVKSKVLFGLTKRCLLYTSRCV